MMTIIGVNHCNKRQCQDYAVLNSRSLIREKSSNAEPCMASLSAEMGDFSRLRPRKNEPPVSAPFGPDRCNPGRNLEDDRRNARTNALSQGPFLPQERLPEVAKNYNNNSRLMMKCLLPLSYLPLLADSRAEEDCFSQQAICYGRIGITDKYRI